MVRRRSTIAYNLHSSSRDCNSNFVAVNLCMWSVLHPKRDPQNFWLVDVLIVDNLVYISNVGKMKQRLNPSILFSSCRSSHIHSAERRILVFLLLCQFVNLVSALHFSTITRRFSYPVLTKSVPSKFPIRLNNERILLQQLNMGKSRSGLEQRRESATPTGAESLGLCSYEPRCVELPSILSF